MQDGQKTILFNIKKVGHLFDRFMGEVKAGIEQKFEDTKNISPIQGRIVLYLYSETQKREVFQKDIETFFDVRSSTAAIILGRMEKNKLITRETSADDERKKTVRLTQKAKKMHPKVLAELQRAEEQIVSGLSRREVEAFLATLDNIMENLSRKS